MAITPVTAASLVQESAPATPAPAAAPLAPAPAPVHGNAWPKRNARALAAFFGRIDFDLEGQPREQWVNRFTTRFDPPWPCVTPWDTSVPIRAIRVHVAVAGSLHRVLGNLATEFGAAFARQQGLNILAPNIFGLQPGQRELTPESFGAAIQFNPGAVADQAAVGDPFGQAASARAEADTAAKAVEAAEAALERAQTPPQSREDMAAQFPDILAAEEAVEAASKRVEAAAALEAKAKTAKEKKEAKEASDAALAAVTTAEEARASALAAAEAKVKPTIDMAKEKVRSAYRLATESEERAQELERLAREAQAKGLEAWGPPSVVIQAFETEGWTWGGPSNPGTFYAVSAD